MKTFQYISDLRASVPANDQQDKYAFLELTREVYLWIGGEWVKRRYFNLKDVVFLTGYPSTDIHFILRNHDRYFDRRKRRGILRFPYKHVLKMKYLLDAMKAGNLREVVASGVIENLYDRSKTYHAL